jgi:hypothetical protein
MELMLGDAIFSDGPLSIATPHVPMGIQGAVWPEPETLSLELPPVMTFDPALLPTSLREMVLDVSERMQVPLDYPAAAAVAALAGVVGRRALIRPKQEDTTWEVVPNLWGGVVAPPGAMKSPVLSAMMAPLRAIEAAWREEDLTVAEDFAMKKEKAELDQQTWRESYRAAQKTGKELPAKPSVDLKVPSQRRLLCSDATFESLHTLLADNPGGIFMLRDELAGWLAGLDRQGREQERAFALESWNGDSSFTVDRIGRGRVHVEHCCLSIFGGIQPARIRGYLADALRDGPLSDGLIQRFGLLVWPDERVGWRYVDRQPDTAAILRAGQMYRSLASLDAANPLILRFDQDAQLLFRDWVSDLERRIRSRELSPAIQAHLSKYRKLMPALALLFALADGDRGRVSLPYAQQAAAWTEYLESHAMRLYSSQCSRERRASITLGLRLCAGWHRQEEHFTLRDVYRPQWEGLATPAEAQAALAELESMGWVRKRQPAVGKVGRTSDRYDINPRLEARHGDT